MEEELDADLPMEMKRTVVVKLMAKRSGTEGLTRIFFVGGNVRQKLLTSGREFCMILSNEFLLFVYILVIGKSWASWF